MTPHRNRWFVVLLLLLLLLLAQQRMQKKWIYLRFSCDGASSSSSCVSAGPRSALWISFRFPQGAFRYLLTPIPDHILPPSIVVGFIYAEAHLPRAPVFFSFNCCFSSYSVLMAFAVDFREDSRQKLEDGLVRMGFEWERTEEDLHSQMKRISAHKNTYTQWSMEKKRGGKGNDEWWPLFGKFRMCGKWMRQICLWCCSFKYDFWRCYYYMRQIFHFEMNCWVDVFLKWDVGRNVSYSVSGGPHQV